VINKDPTTPETLCYNTLLNSSIQNWQRYLQGNVAKRLRCDGVFIDHFIANLLLTYQ